MSGSNAIHRDVRYNDIDFSTACKSFAVAWRRKHGRGVEVPVISHALSDLRGGERWMACAETGEIIASVDYEGQCTLIEDDPDDGRQGAREAPESPVAALQAKTDTKPRVKTANHHYPPSPSARQTQ